MGTVNILPEVYQKIMFWVDECDKEISGFGKVVVKDGAYWVIEAYLLEQEVSGATTDIDAVALGKLMAETIKERGHLNFWWHSHVDMGAFWSGTDTDTIREIGEAGFCLATVFNKKRETRTAYYQGGDDFLPAIFVDDMKLQINHETSTKLETKWKKEMKSKVRVKAFAPVKQYQNNHQSYYKGNVRESSWDYGSVWCQEVENWLTPAEAAKKEREGRKKVGRPRKNKSKKVDTTKEPYVYKRNSLRPWQEIQHPERVKWSDLYEMYMGERPISMYGQDLQDFYNTWGEFNVDNLLNGMTA